MKTSIALIGFMGTGKTAGGKVLAGKLGKEYIELDSMVERKAGKTIPEIFQQEGETAFRELEIMVTREVSGRRNVVIACGGGVVLNKINIDRLRKECLIICLTASPGVILQRTSNSIKGRPLLNVDNRTREVRKLLKLRKPFYEQAADITIDTSKLDIDSVVEQIISRVEASESCNC